MAIAFKSDNDVIVVIFTLFQGDVKFPNDVRICAGVGNKRPNELYIRSVPADLTIGEFKKILRNAQIEFKDANLALSPKFKTESRELKEHHAILTPLIPDVVHIEVTCPRDESVEFRAFANFARAELALRAVEAINGRLHPVSNARLTATPRSNLYFFVSEEVVGCVEPTFFEPYLNEIKATLGERAQDLMVSLIKYCVT